MNSEPDSLAFVMIRGYTKQQVVDMVRARLNGATQSDLASEIGISRGYLADVLSGRALPGPAILHHLGLEAGYIKSERAA